MFKKFLLILFFLFMALPNSIFAGRGGAAFGGAFAGSMVGGLMTGAMQKKDKVVVVQQPQSTETQAQMEERIRKEIELENRINELNKQLEEKKSIVQNAPKRPQAGQKSRREVENRIKDLEEQIQTMKKQLEETKK
mgnify:CR=1 FL=1